MSRYTIPENQWSSPHVETSCPYCSTTVNSFFPIVRVGNVRMSGPMSTQDWDEIVALLLDPCLHTVEGCFITTTSITWRDDRPITKVST